MTKTRDDLQQMLAELEEMVPVLIAKHADEETFWLAFSSKANVILGEAATDDFDWLFASIDNVLDKHGVPLPADPADLSPRALD